MDKVPLVDLRAALAPIRAELFEQFGAILDRMQLYLGPQVTRFESEFAAFCQVAHGISVSSGTDALFVALRACGIGPGDEVVVPSLTFFATIEAICHTGATPVFCDVEPDQLTIDVSRIPAALSPATRAIVPVHLYGHPARMDPILQIAGAHGLRVIEDAAQAHGALDRQRRCGSMSTAASFSFYFTKNLGGLGEGGFVTTNDAEVAERARLLRNHGHVSKFEHGLVGHNFRMDELQAAVLRLKLRTLEKDNQRRRQLAANYARRLDHPNIQVLGISSDCEPVHQVYPIRVQQRDRLRALLEANGIETGIHYKIPAHRQPAMKQHPHRCGAMPVTDEVCDQLLSIPMYAQLTDRQQTQVIDQVLQGCRQL